MAGVGADLDADSSQGRDLIPNGHRFVRLAASERGERWWGTRVGSGLEGGAGGD